MSEYPHILSRNRLQEASTVEVRNSSEVVQAEDAVYVLDHLTDRARGSLWKGPASMSEVRVIWSFGTAVTLDTFVLDRGFTLSGGSCTLYWQHSATGAVGDWTTAFTLSVPDSDSIYWRTWTAVSRQFWRLRITNLTARPQIFNLWAGARIELTFGPMGEFDPWEEQKIGQRVNGENGGGQWVQRYTQRLINAQFRNLTDTQIALLRQWWTEAGREGKNFWWLTSPTSAADDPIYLNDYGKSWRFPIALTTRSGEFAAEEAL